MNPTRKLKKRLEKLEGILRKYEILENMIKNDDDGKIRMFSVKKVELSQWLKDNKDVNDKVKKEYYEIKEQLKEME